MITSRFLMLPIGDKKNIFPSVGSAERVGFGQALARHHASLRLTTVFHYFFCPEKMRFAPFK
ncbi:MAG: hypothetical protein AB1546_02935, partial [bacterium]